MSLYVHAGRRLVGEARLEPLGPSWRYDPQWSLGEETPALSLSLKNEGRAPEWALDAWLDNLLPGPVLREALAQALGSADQSAWSILEKCGLDLAGAFSVGTARLPGPGSHRAIDGEAALVRIFNELKTRPMLCGVAGAASLLPGDRDKLAVVIQDGRLALPVLGAPSTHIVKLERYPGEARMEAYALTLARRSGLTTVTAKPQSAGGHGYLLIDRFDRRIVGGEVRRLHSESVLQALGLGGRLRRQKSPQPRIADVFALIRRVMTAREILALFDALTFNLILAAPSWDLRNIGVILTGPRPRLAPLWSLRSPLLRPEPPPPPAVSAPLPQASDLAPGPLGAGLVALARECGLAGPAAVRRAAVLAHRVARAAAPALSVVADPDGPSEEMTRLCALIQNRAAAFAAAVPPPPERSRWTRSRPSAPDDDGL